MSSPPMEAAKKVGGARRKSSGSGSPALNPKVSEEIVAPLDKTLQTSTPVKIEVRKAESIAKASSKKAGSPVRRMPETKRQPVYIGKSKSRRPQIHHIQQPKQGY